MWSQESKGGTAPAATEFQASWFGLEKTGSFVKMWAVF